MNQTMTVREQVSALADGHLHGEAFAQAIEAVCADGEAREAWQAIHVAGDVLRSGSHAQCTDTSAFLSRFQQRLAAEPVVFAPVAIPVAAPVALPAQRRAEAANEPVFRWKLVAGAASLMAVAAISWTLVGNGAAVQQAGPQVASVQQQQQPAVNSVLAAAAVNSDLPATNTLTPTRVIVGNGNPQVMLRDPRLDQLLEAHQQAGGASQMPSGFLRNATFEGPTR
ncbi:sigma-E factor negative regulatory protein [Variovorax sp. J22G73]|jgi:sigma-E factor negative regulatory protein RseA|uniref:sigma-E factor negative regulatory protein n=1 Tax=unclassified Variovorax TaxID=663243 RepID=UPI000D5D8B95|nr:MULTISPECIES: sigma-E factor negative regulatory protein [unclassified Variovorax]MDM0004160.1 sigma-E factor negative regulatory protein [Variovorax sp. J22R203]MDM0096174.1 sigma-E factor negative regulatory protein [Variovorax sp. J22G73]